jgi:hypothetical protein
LEAWISTRNPVTVIESPFMDPAEIAQGNESAMNKRAARAAARAESGSGSESSMEVLSEA